MAGTIFDTQTAAEISLTDSAAVVTTQGAAEVSITSTFAVQLTQAVAEIAATRTFSVVTTQIALEICVITCASTSYVPPAPTGVITLTAVSAGVNTHAINLAWNSVPGFTYTVERSLLMGGPYTPIAPGLTGTTYENTGLTYHQTYYYIIVATDTCGNTTTSNEAFATADCTLPPIPAGLRVNLAPGGIALHWDSVPGSTYDLYRGLLPGREGNTPVASGLTTTTYFDPWTNPGFVFYKAQAINECGPGALSPEGYILVPAIQTVSPCITGFDVMNEVQVRLRESQSTTAQQQSMLYLRHVRRALDEIGRRTWSIFDAACTDLIAGQIEYVMPHRPFELRSVCINDGNGNIFPLAGLTVEQADKKFFNWQNTTQPGPLWSGVPLFYVDEGTNRFWLLPTPNYSQQAGLIVRGYYGVDKWYQMDMCLPLPEGFDECVIVGTAWRRCIEMAPQDPLYGQMLKEYKADFEEICRRLYRERINRDEATRNQIPSNGQRISAWSGSWFWTGG